MQNDKKILKKITNKSKTKALDKEKQNDIIKTENVKMRREVRKKSGKNFFFLSNDRSDIYEFF